MRAYPNLLILCTGGEELAIGAEADAADVEVAGFAGCLVDEHAVGRINTIIVDDTLNNGNRTMSLLPSLYHRSGQFGCIPSRGTFHLPRT